MKTYAVYGMGNALVDTEFQVTDADLAKAGIDKSSNDLYNEEQLKALMHEFTDKPHLQAGGGSAANTMVTVAQLGAKPFYSCRVASDQAGQFYHEDLNKLGVTTNQDHVTLPEGQTGCCVVMLTPDANRSMRTCLGISASYSPQELVLSELEKSAYLYIEGYLLASDTATEAVMQAKSHAEANGVMTSLTLSDPFMIAAFRERFETLLAKPVDLLFCNDAEAKDFAKVDSVEAAAEVLKKYAKRFVITQGGDGATLFDGNQVKHLPISERVSCIDTLGAGDSYAGAFLYAINSGFEFIDCGRIANLVAGQVVSKLGPRLTQNEADGLKEKIDQIRKQAARTAPV